MHYPASSVPSHVALFTMDEFLGECHRKSDIIKVFVARKVF
jgi:hypothetical protein